MGHNSLPNGQEQGGVGHVLQVVAKAVGRTVLGEILPSHADVSLSEHRHVSPSAVEPVARPVEQ